MVNSEIVKAKTIFNLKSYGDETIFIVINYEGT